METRYLGYVEVGQQSVLLCSMILSCLIQLYEEKSVQFIFFVIIVGINLAYVGFIAIVFWKIGRQEMSEAFIGILSCKKVAENEQG